MQCFPRQYTKGIYLHLLLDVGGGVWPKALMWLQAPPKICPSSTPYPRLGEHTLYVHVRKEAMDCLGTVFTVEDTCP